MFFAPLALAFYLYYGKVSWHPGHRVNSGELVEPPRPLPALSLPLAGANGLAGMTPPGFLRGKWTLLYLKSGRCEATCGRLLYETRQVRLALDREMNRVQRVFIEDADCCDLRALRESHPDLLIIRSSDADQRLRNLLPNTGDQRESGSSADAKSSREAVLPDRVYLIDPLGNLMMFYAADANPKGMLEDMKRLLRLSSIG